MRLKKIQEYMQERGWKYQYTEEEGLGSMDWEHRGLIYHIWEFSDDGAESNVRMAGKMEDYTGDYEEQIIGILKEW